MARIEYKRRVAYVGNADDVMLTGGRALWEDLPYRGYVGHPLSDDPYQTQLWADIRAVERGTKMTARQAQVFEGYVLGISNIAMARVLGVTESAISKTLHVVMVKSENYPKSALLTVVYEECGGWRAVGELLNG